MKRTSGAVRPARSVAAVGLCVIALAGCSPSSQQRAKNDLNDVFIAAQVRAKIAAVDPATVSLVKVDVLNRSVTLTGQVHSTQERSNVDVAARSVGNVTKVDDRLTVNPKAPTADEMANDLSLQAKVQAALAAQTGVNALKVRVSVHAGVVTLEGAAASPVVHELVLETARGVPGVKRVIDRVRVEHR
jgi:hyperosmotically inducible periplasmic protein